MLGRVYRAADMALRPHAPVLRESRDADDGGRVHSPFAPDLVGAAVAFEGAIACVVGIVRRVVLVAEVFDHVVLNERFCGPTVQPQICVSVGAEGAGVVEEPELWSVL